MQNPCQSCQLKVKITGQGHGFEFWISCPLHISYTPGRIFFKLWSYVCLSEAMCRTHNSTIPTQGQGHSSRSQVWALNRVRSVSPIPVEGFSLNFGQCSCAESITQPCRLKIKVTVQGHGFEPWISCPLCISFTPGRIFSKLWSNVHLWDDVQNPYLNHGALRTRSQFKVVRLSSKFRVHSISPLSLEGFSFNLVKCLPQWNDVQNP